ncbi:MAG TPA: M20/M25/M40 family metallo-hydrolase [Gammaproteobacteria bacterium]|nr:M20/M25/M40 family metallo-hydrolase [Gammaproteobacteria bacterium]
MAIRRARPRIAARLALALCLLAGAGAAGVAHAGSLEHEVERAAQRNFGEYLELLRRPNVAAVPADIARNAAYLERELERHALRARLVGNAAGRPVVLGELGAGASGLPTVLFYVHYDGQPVVASEWSQKDPFGPVVKRRTAAGAWEEVGAEALEATPLDPELRVFARSAADDKAPIVMFLTAVDLLSAQQRAPAFDVKVLLDGEEEIGSPSLAETIASDREAFRADALVILDGPVHASGRPTLVLGNRGLAQTKLVVFGPRAPLHSGHYGNYVPNPAQRLAALLATMKDDDGRVLIEGYYDGVDLTPDDRAALAAVGDDERALRERVGIAHPERVGASYQEALQYPSLNVRGMAAGGVGASAANVIPSEAVAEIDIRTTPGTDGRRLYELVRRHIERQGYHLVDGAPTDEERARYDKLASFTLGSVQAAERMPLDSDIAQWAAGALAAPTAPRPGDPPVRIRMMGATVPTDVLVDALHLPFVLVPTVNPDNNQHARDENLRIGNFVTGTETIYSLLTTPFETAARPHAVRPQ